MKIKNKRIKKETHQIPEQMELSCAIARKATEISGRLGSCLSRLLGVFFSGCEAPTHPISTLGTPL